jgi:hypothetical protein
VSRCLRVLLGQSSSRCFLCQIRFLPPPEILLAPVLRSSGSSLDSRSGSVLVAGLCLCSRAPVESGLGPAQSSVLGFSFLRWSSLPHSSRSVLSSHRRRFSIHRSLISPTRARCQVRICAPLRFDVSHSRFVLHAKVHRKFLCRRSMLWFLLDLRPVAFDLSVSSIFPLVSPWFRQAFSLGLTELKIDSSLSSCLSCRPPPIRSSFWLKPVCS